MKRVGVAELKDNLSSYLRAAEAGADVEVTDRGRPIARIVAARGNAITLRPAQRPFSAVRGRRHRRAGWDVSSLDLLLEERGDR